MMLDKILKERGNRYGEFKTHAEITQQLKRVITAHGVLLDDSKREALEMIAHKIGRILNGDPNYIESWRDLAGYAQLIVDELYKREGATDGRVVSMKVVDGNLIDEI